MRPSKSLDGLEKVIPPGSFLVSRSDLSLHKLLNKPLPAKPLPEPPPEETCSTLYSHESIIDDYASRTETENSTDDYLLHLASAEDEDESDIDDLALRVRAPFSTVDLTHDRLSSLGLTSKSFLIDERYGMDIYSAQARFKNSPYFREKKLDFFPELAISSGLQAAASRQRSARRKLDAVAVHPALPLFSLLPLTETAVISISPVNKRLIPAQGLRDSIRSCMQKTLATRSTFERLEKEKDAPWGDPHRYSSSRGTTHSNGPSVSRGGGLQHGLVDVYDGMRLPSVSSGPGSDEEAPALRIERRKQRAVSMTPYQKYGPQIWETPRRSKRASDRKGHHVKSPCPTKTSPMIQTRECASLSPTSPRSTSSRWGQRDYMKALHDGTKHVLSALDGAKRRITESRADRRRLELKRQIRVIGPTELSAEKNVSYWV